MPTVVLIDSDLARSSGFTAHLRQHGYDVLALRDLRAVAHHLHLDEADLLIVGETSDDHDANEVCRQVRSRSDIPIMVLSSTRDELPEVLALDSGADEFLRSPVSARVMRARVAALVRRGAAAAHQRRTAQVIGPLEFDLSQRTAKIHGAQIRLSKTEFTLLAALADNPHRVLTRAELVERVWGRWHDDDHVLDVTLSRLRCKIRAAGGPRVGQSVSGFGYRLGIEPAAVG